MKVKEQNISITINQESYLSSLAKDLTSLGSLGFLFWFNYNFIGGSYLVNFLILCMIFLYICKIQWKLLVRRLAKGLERQESQRVLQMQPKRK